MSYLSLLGLLGQFNMGPAQLPSSMKMNEKATSITVSSGLNVRHTAGSFAVVAIAIGNGRSVIEEVVPLYE
jgi:hypothetical protein